TRLTTRAQLTTTPNTTWDHIWHTLATPQPTTTRHKRSNDNTEPPTIHAAPHQPASQSGKKRRTTTTQEAAAQRSAARREFHRMLDKARDLAGIKKSTMPDTVQRYISEHRTGLIPFTYANDLINQFFPSNPAEMRRIYEKADGGAPESFPWTDPVPLLTHPT
ncbi:hypothetical protein ACFYPT_38110, partial [Streptomyces sp. NPDC005529]